MKRLLLSSFTLLFFSTNGSAHSSSIAPGIDVVLGTFSPNRQPDGNTVIFHAPDGLIVMDTPGQDIEQMTGMIAGGAQVVVFTTGRGTPTGSAIAPVIKVATNSTMFEHMRENMDVNAGTILDGTRTLEEVGDEIFDWIVDAANGRQPAAEALGFHDFAINRIGPSF